MNSMTFAIPLATAASAFAWLSVNGSLAQVAPVWWDERGVLSTNAANDYAALNSGQLKNLAFMAWHELEKVPGGAGFEPVFTNGGNNFVSVNIGQLKEVARPFYDRVGLNMGSVMNGSPADDFSPANIGQAKYLFSLEWRCAGDLDQDGMPDAWELENGLDPRDGADASTDYDSDGRSNLDEWLMGSSPTMADTGCACATGASAPQKGAGGTGLLILSPAAAE